MKKIKNGKWRRQERQEEAVERNEAYASLDTHERVKRAVSRRGESKRELKRLQGE